MTPVLKFLKAIFSKIFPFAKPKLHYFALGDSTVEGIGATSPAKGYVGQLVNFLAKDFRVSVTNLGKKGAATFDVMENQLPHLLGHKPQLVTISVGPNDIRKLRRTSEFYNNLQVILGFLSATGANVVINTIPDMSRLPAIPKVARWLVRKRVEQFNNVIWNLAALYNVTVCDLFEKSKQFEARKEYIANDGFHLSNTGYHLWASFLHAKVKPLLVK